MTLIMWRSKTLVRHDTLASVLTLLTCLNCICNVQCRKIRERWFGMLCTYCCVVSAREAHTNLCAGGAVRRYDGRKLVVSISSEYAIGLRRPPRGKPKRHVEFAAGQFQLKSCPELPHEEDRVPLQLSRRSSSSSGRNRGAPKWNRC